MALGAALLVVLLAGADPGHAASFDCAKAQSATEKMVCADAEVSTLDEHLAQYYAGARLALREGAACLADDQRQWLRTVRNACADAGCLKKAYVERLGTLHALQPGATSLRNMELPSTPQLAWIIPPAADNVAAPRRPNAQPLVAQGRLVDDVAQGDGFLLRTPEGATHVLLMLMFIDGASADRLPLLAREANATYLARGHAAPGSGARADYEPSRCVYLYRMP